MADDGNLPVDLPSGMISHLSDGPSKRKQGQGDTKRGGTEIVARGGI